MKIIEPKVEFMEQHDFNSHVADCARVCYKKESGDDARTVNNLVLNKHFSMLRHYTYYYIIKNNYIPMIYNFATAIQNGIVIAGLDIKVDYYNNCVFVVANGQFVNEHINIIRAIKYFEVDKNEFKNYEIGYNMLRYTFKVTTQISTSRELNRVSPNNISEQSTRYVYEDGTLCCPHWININMISMNSINQIQAVYNNDGSYNKAAEYYLIKCQDKFDAYKYLINHFNVHRQDARGVLPLDTATVCIYTYSIEEWRHIIDLRYYGTTGKPHPNAKIIAGMIKNELEQLGYEFAKENI